MDYVVVFNDGRAMWGIPSGEAKFWAWMSMDYVHCNVYAEGGDGLSLTPFDIYAREKSR